MKVPPTIMVPVSSIKTDPSNPNQMTDKQLAALKEGIKRFGFLNPIILNKEGIIIDGEHRYKAAQALGMTEVPTITLEVDKIDHRILRQTLNKLRGTHDIEADILEYKEILAADKMEDFAALLGQERDDILKLLDTQPKIDEEDDFDLDAELAKIETPTTKPGDTWKLGKHLLHCGDSTTPEAYNFLNGEKARITFTDPPYNVDYGITSGSIDSHGRTIKHDAVTPQQYEEFHNKFIKEICTNTANDIYCWHAPGPDGMALALSLAKKLHWSATISWYKHRPGFNRSNYHRQYELCFYGWQEKSSYGGKKTESDVWQVERPTKSKEHPMMKPLALCRKAILNSTLANDTVLDPFGGSGSTLIACEQTIRQCRMIELSPKYCDVIIERFKRFTGIQAERTHDRQP